MMNKHLINFLHSIGLTNLTDYQVTLYKNINSGININYENIFKKIYGLLRHKILINNKVYKEEGVNDLILTTYSKMILEHERNLLLNNPLITKRYASNACFIYHYKDKKWLNENALKKIGFDFFC